MADTTPTLAGVRSVRMPVTAPGTSRVAAFGATHPGHHRAGNEDAFIVAPELGLAVVADGVATSGGGAIAAQTVVTAMRDYFARGPIRDLLTAIGPNDLAQVSELLVAAADDAHHRVREVARTSGLENMGTTLAMVMLVAGHAFVMHAGDSRVHRFRGGRIEQITDDHTALNEWIARYGPPTEAVIARLEHVIVRAVSTRMAAVRPDLWVEPAERGDVFLLSTDGLTKVVPEHILQDIVCAAPDLEVATLSLVEAALAAGGPDNVTAALFRLDGEDDAARRERAT